MLSKALIILRLAYTVTIIIVAFKINELSSYFNYKAIYSITSIYVVSIN